MTPQLTNIKNTAGVEAVINCGFGQGPAIVTRNYRQLAIPAPLYQSHGVSSKSYLKLAGDAAEGVRLPAAAAIVAEQLPDSDPLKKVVMDVQDQVREADRRAGLDLRRPHVRWPDDAGAGDERAKSADKAKVRDEIEKTKNFIGTGGVVNMSPTDHLGLDLTSFRMIEVKNGDWKLLQ